MQPVRRFRPCLAASAMLLALTGAAWSLPVAAAHANWSPASVSLTHEGANAIRPEVAVDSAGVATAVWEGFNGAPGVGWVIESSSKSPGGSWETPVPLTTEGAAQLPELGVDGSGEATAVWEWRSPIGSTRGDAIQAASRPAGGAWQPPVDISAEGAPGLDHPELAVNGSGEAVAVWEQSNTETSTGKILAAIRPAGGTWSAPVTVSAPGESALEPQVALDPSGDAVVVWQRMTPGNRQVIQAAVHPAGGGWLAEEDLSTGANTAFNPDVVLGPSGEAVVVWEGYDGTNMLIESSARPWSGSWESSAQLSEGGENAVDPRLAIDSEGEATAVWRRSDGTNLLAQAAERPAGGSWTPSVTLSAPGGSVQEPRVAEDSRGNAIAIWERFDGRWVVQASARPAGAGWQPPGDLGLGTSDEEPRIALDASGNAAAVWTGHEAGGQNTIRAATDSAASPAEPDLTVPAGLPEQPVTVLASWPLNPWLQLRSADWSLGDGSSALGTTATHSYAQAGEYPVGFEAEDVLGRKFDASSTVLIEPAPIEFTAQNWSFAASLKPHRLRAALVTPSSSTFNGAGVIHPGSGEGSLTGSVSVPGFQTSALGTRQVRLGVSLTQAGAIVGQLKRVEPSSTNEMLTIPVQLNMAITSATWGGITYPLHCATWAPVLLHLSATLSQASLLSTTWSFAGTTTVPGINCVKPPRGITASWLSYWLSNSATPFSVTLAPPP